MGAARYPGAASASRTERNFALQVTLTRDACRPSRRQTASAASCHTGPRSMPRKTVTRVKGAGHESFARRQLARRRRVSGSSTAKAGDTRSSSTSPSSTKPGRPARPAKPPRIRRTPGSTIIMGVPHDAALLGPDPFIRSTVTGGPRRGRPVPGSRSSPWSPEIQDNVVTPIVGGKRGPSCGTGRTLVRLMRRLITARNVRYEPL